MDIDVKSGKTAARAGVALVVGLIAAPLVAGAIYGLVGLFAIGAIAFVGIQFQPVFVTFVKNQQLVALKRVVEANPIETLKNLYIEKSNELTEADRNIRDFDAEIQSYDDSLSDFKHTDPEEVPRFQEISRKMHLLFDTMVEKQEDAKKALGVVEQKIEKAERIYNMAKAAQKVLSFSKSAEAAVFSQIKQQIAFDTVRTEMNRASAALGQALREKQTFQLSQGQQGQDFGGPKMIEAEVVRK